MSEKTTNYELLKPERTDTADITAYNSNWDTIDTLLKDHSDAKIAHKTKLDEHDTKLTNSDKKFENYDVQLVTHTATANGNNFNVTIPGLNSLYLGLRIRVKFEVDGVILSRLNVNGLSDSYIYSPINGDIQNTKRPTVPIIKQNTILDLIYNGTTWVAFNVGYIDLNFISESIPIARGGTGATTSSGALANLGAAPINHGNHIPNSTTSDNGKFLRVVDGVATWTTVGNAEGVSF